MGSLGSEPSRIISCRCGGVVAFDAVVQSWEVAFEDTEIGGYPIAEGEAVFPLLGACNHDWFDDPDNFRITKAIMLLPSVWVPITAWVPLLPNGSLNYP